MKRILITGASRGIGKSLALEIAKNEKAKFALISKNVELLQKVQREIQELGSTSVFYSCNVGNIIELQNAIINANKFLSGVDIAVLNAGVSHNKWIFQEGYAETFEEVYRTNVFGIAYALEILPTFMQKPGGKIVIISSLADARGFPSSSAYSSSKAAVTKLAEAARIELKPLGIDVITVKPGFVKTDMTAKNKFPMPFLLEPDEASKIIWNGIINNRKSIQFPLPMVILTKFIAILPNSIFDFLA
ncbi:MAG: SDR family NAD(P)-dependent oxidoreductase, partial [Candidatus Kapaibacteriota bacterium]